MISRLTERAKSIINDVSGVEGKSVDIESIILSIKNSGGVGTHVLNSNPRLRFKNLVPIDVSALVERAYYYSALLQHVYVGTEHLLVALLDLSSSPDTEKIRIQVSRISTFPNHHVSADFSEKTPLINSFGINLNKKWARYKVSPPVYREEVELLISILLQKENPNPLIIGNHGVGRKSLVDLLVHKISSLDVPVALAGCQVIEFDAMAFIANVSGREGVEVGITTFLEELASVGDAILYIKDFQGLFVGTNVGFAIPLAFSMLKSYLVSAGVSVIGVVSESFYERISSESAQLLSSFKEVRVSEPLEDKTLEILNVKSGELGKFHNMIVPADVARYAYNKAKSEIKRGHFPQKAVDLLDRACCKLLLKKDFVPEKYKDLIEKKSDISAAVTKSLEAGDFDSAIKFRNELARINKKLEKTRERLCSGDTLSLSALEIDEALLDIGLGSVVDDDVDLGNLSSLAERITERIVGQDSAVDTVSRAMVRSKLGLRPKKRPLGNFLFLGPTGVGKTELAKVLADCAFGEDSLIRLDMSDFGEKHTVARLVGAPPGYVGYGEGGELTIKINDKPDSVVLFDEIEKAHPDVLNILLQIMEEGELSDAKGQTFDFSQAVVVLTSNVGTDLVLKDGIGFSGGVKSDDEVENRLRENLKKIMKPELLNRFDEIIVFKRLRKPAQTKILNLLLDEIKETLSKQKISIKVYSDVKKHLLKLGYSGEFGARALRRTVETELLDRVAEFLLKNSKRPLRLKAQLVGKKIKISAY